MPDYYSNWLATDPSIKRGNEHVLLLSVKGANVNVARKHGRALKLFI
jgi:hypothetical protein